MRLQHLLLVTLALACAKDLEEEPTEVHVDFRPDFELFIQESLARGLALDTSGLVIQYSDALVRTTCGQCSFGQNLDRERTISINREEICWQNKWEKETLLFHELGHCLLQRDHLSDTLSNGAPKSIMVERKLSLYGPCIYAFGEVEDCNLIYRREYYIDELFDVNAEAPEWSTR